jgi:F-type H+-transporting ATPase subunit a
MVVQDDVYTIILLTIILGIGIVWVSKKIDKLDPMKKPTGITGAVILGVQAVANTCITNVGKDIAYKLAPYILTLWIYIFCSNTCSLFGLTSPTANLSVTLLLAIITWVLIQIVEFKYGGVKAYFHAFIEPIAPMLPLNIIGKFSTLVSMSLRLFGNITCGGIMMELVYTGAQILSNTIAGWFGATGNVFNFMAPIITPLLHGYFDVFAGFIQTLVFVTLTVVLLGVDVPDEVKNS